MGRCRRGNFVDVGVWKSEIQSNIPEVCAEGKQAMFASYIGHEVCSPTLAYLCVQTMQTKAKRVCSHSTINSPLLPQFSSFLLHTYLLRRPKIKNMGSYFTRPALHSAASSKVWYPSGSQRGQFLIAFLLKENFFHCDRRLER
jgi:hypothetical protein